jgi:hypothetical protein
MILRVLERYWAKVDKRGENTCWNWKGARTTGGYGQLGGGTKRSKWKAAATHIALAIDNRPRPSLLHVAMHSCDNPRCVNPRHLSWGTHTENMQDMWQKERSGIQKRAAIMLDDAAASLGTMQAGNVKLNEDQARFIRSTDMPTSDLARLLNVSWQTVDNVRKGRTWRWLL